MEITYRPLSTAELSDIKAIDRKEVITEMYKLSDGKLCTYSSNQVVDGFTENEIGEISHRQSKLISFGGIIIGAFDGTTLVGVASVEKTLRGPSKEWSKLDVLYVSNNFRKHGIGNTLLGLCKKIALSNSAKKLYISATPTKNTVDFYLKRNAMVVAEPDQELYELEPADIHLEIALDS